MPRRNPLLAGFDMNTGNTEMKPGDPAYSPTDVVTQSPVQYGQRPEVTNMNDRGPAQSSGWWGEPTTVHPSQYINQSVGGVAGDTQRMTYRRGLTPFGYLRQPFTGAVLTPPRPAMVLSGNVGRLGQRDNLAARVKASLSDYQPTPEQVANTMINPQLGW